MSPTFFVVSGDAARLRGLDAEGSTLILGEKRDPYHWSDGYEPTSTALCWGNPDDLLLAPGEDTLHAIAFGRGRRESLAVALIDGDTNRLVRLAEAIMRGRQGSWKPAALGYADDPDCIADFPEAYITHSGGRAIPSHDVIRALLRGWIPPSWRSR